MKLKELQNLSIQLVNQRNLKNKKISIFRFEFLDRLHVRKNINKQKVIIQS